MAGRSSLHPSALFRSVYPGKYPLRTNCEDDIQAVLASFDLLHHAVVRSLPHPFGALGGIPSGPS